jgi:hypothetical protein
VLTDHSTRRVGDVRCDLPRASASVGVDESCLSFACSRDVNPALSPSGKGSATMDLLEPEGKYPFFFGLFLGTVGFPPGFCPGQRIYERKPANIIRLCLAESVSTQRLEGTRVLAVMRDS